MSMTTTPIESYYPIKELIDQTFPTYVPYEILFSIKRDWQAVINSAIIVPNPATMNGEVKLQVDVTDAERLSIYNPLFTGTIQSGMTFYAGEIPGNGSIQGSLL